MTEWVKNIEGNISSQNIVSISTMEEREEVCLKDEAGVNGQSLVVSSET